MSDDDFTDDYSVVPAIRDALEAYRDTGSFYFLAKAVATNLSASCELEQWLAAELKKHLDAFCSADDARAAQKALGLVGGRDGGSSPFSRAKTYEKRLEILRDVELSGDFRDLRFDPPEKAPLADDFKTVAEFHETTPDFVKQLWYERQRSK